MINNLKNINYLIGLIITMADHFNLIKQLQAEQKEKYTSIKM